MSLPLTTLIEVPKGNLRFLITDKPTQANVQICTDVFTRHGVAALVRVCHEDDYSTEPMEKAGIECHALAFDDGTQPPDEIISKWLSIVDGVFSKKKSKKSKKSKKAPADGGKGDSANSAAPCIAIHCVAGLGRAPLMVAVALLSAGLKCSNVVALIRKNRPGCINRRQLTWLKAYKPKKKKSGGAGKDDECTIM